ncbi:MAG: sigma-54 dependent transcriptional regulator [Gammaproteobacteria bacterium]|nr:sigma-54 dependent transcriptional regulator [Gammaproteobacteria bacterium]
MDGGTPPALLLVDDDPLIADALEFVLAEDYTVATARSRPEARAILQSGRSAPLLALVDLGLPPDTHVPDEGFQLIQELLAFNPRVKILVLSGQSGRANIQHALTLGAVDFIPKPTDTELLKARLAHQLMILEAESDAAEAQPDGCNILGDSPPIRTLREQIDQFADTPFPVLVEGESGVGKELVAECLHRLSRRAGEPSLIINCAAIAAELLEAQLFGHAKGAYTGAATAKAGFFEDAGRGTLFLDEIGDFPLDLQPKLLRVLENGEYYRVGETRPRTAQARIVAATNRDLREEVRAGRFREDLYHRLSVLTIRVPPLRERGDDRILLLERFRRLYSRGSVPFRLTEQAVQRLAAYGFPGNVRELRNIVIRLTAKYAGREVDEAALALELETGVVARVAREEGSDEAVQLELVKQGFRLDEVLDRWEQRYIRTALELTGGNLSQAARMLGVNRTTLYSRLQRLGMDADASSRH